MLLLLLKCFPATTCQICIVVMNAHPTIVCGIGKTWLVEITAYQITAHIFLFLLKWNYRPLTPPPRATVNKLDWEVASGFF